MHLHGLLEMLQLFLKYVVLGQQLKVLLYGAGAFIHVSKCISKYKNKVIPTRMSYGSEVLKFRYVFSTHVVKKVSPGTLSVVDRKFGFDFVKRWAFGICKFTYFGLSLTQCELSNSNIQSNQLQKNLSLFLSYRKNFVLFVQRSEKATTRKFAIFNG